MICCQSIPPSVTGPGSEIGRTAYRDTIIIVSRKIWRELYLAIWPPTAEIKYWRNLIFAICDSEAKFHYVILACGYAEVNLAENKNGGAVARWRSPKRQMKFSAKNFRLYSMPEASIWHRHGTSINYIRSR